MRVVLLSSCASVLFLTVEASRQAIPVNLVSDTTFAGKPLRVLQLPGQCMWVDEVQKQFCCNEPTKGDCEIEYDWFLEDNIELLENAERKKEA